MFPGLDVVVVNYQTPWDLHNFIVSYERYLPQVESRLIVANVDPHEDDRHIGEWAKTYIEWDENIGYARAVNEATTLCNSEIIGIFNADTRLTPGVLQTCYEALMTHEDWAILGPRLIDDEGRITHGGFFGTNIKKQERGFHHRNSDSIYGDIRDDALTVSGAAYFIKRSVWDVLRDCDLFTGLGYGAPGAFLPTPHYFEETWCSFHARHHGYKIVYYGAATMHHKWHAASPRGGQADRKLPTSRRMFQEACDAHGIEHE